MSIISRLEQGQDMQSLTSFLACLNLILLGSFFAICFYQSYSGSSVLATQTSPATPSRCPSSAAASAADALGAKFDDHQFVFIGTTHGDAKIDEFLMCLISRPAFRQRVSDIVQIHATFFAIVC